MKEVGMFKLYDLTVIVSKINGNCTCNMKVGDKFFLKGGKISLPEKSEFCIYALQSTIPLLPVKQRPNNSEYDWIETDNEIICPDPACKLVMEIKRGSLRNFDHNEVSNNRI